MNRAPEDLERELHPDADQAAGELRDMRREIKASDRLAYLRAHQILWDSKQGGRMIIIRRNGRTFECWPGTGKWRERDTSIGRSRVFFHRPATRTGNDFESLVRTMGERRP